MTGLQNKRVAVVGTGLAGLVAIKECLAEGLEPVAFEKRHELGGNWAADRDPSEEPSPVYDGVLLNSCRDTSSYSDFPFDPESHGDYFSHRKLGEYLRRYATHFKLHKHIHFCTRVLECIPLPDGQWNVKVQEDGGEGSIVEEVLCGAVVVAAGQQNAPNMPDFPGKDSFQGDFLHSQEYWAPGRFQDKRVAIIGLGSTAVDISSEIAPHAKECHVVSRSGTWVLPRFALGGPLEKLDSRLYANDFGHGIGVWATKLLINFLEGPAPKGLQPEYNFLEQVPTVRSGYYELIRTGLINLHRSEVASITQTGLALSTGETLDVDVIISCTGYLRHLPFVPADAVRSATTAEHRADLYQQIYPIRYKNLCFVGLADTAGPIASAFEAQARHVAAVLSGRISLPSDEEMQKSITRHHAFQAKHYTTIDSNMFFMDRTSYIDGLLAPLGANPSFGRMLGKCFTSNPWTALKLLFAVWFGIMTSAQWRLYGHGSAFGPASATVLRSSAGKDKLDAKELQWFASGKEE